MTLDPDHLRNAKEDLRRQALGVRRAAFDPSAKDRLAAFAERIPPGEVVAGYWPLGDEMDPRPLMIALGRPLALPVVVDKNQPLEFRRWQPGDPMEAGRHGTTHPKPGAPVIPDLLLVPLLAFDRHGFRLGYGGGYYDRTLDSLRTRGQITAIGVAFAAQELAEVPHGPYDQSLDGVITEAGLLMMERL